MSMKKNTMGIIFCMLFLFGSTVYAETTIEERYDYYAIEVSPETDLIAELDAKSPVRFNNAIYHAYTATNIAWTFGWQNEQQGCHITWVNTAVEIIYTLPQLQNGDLGPKLRPIWDRWYPALQMHEHHHGEIAIKTAGELESSILQLPSFSDCKELEEYANQLGDTSIEKLGNRHREYDARTNHGEKEGAALYSYF
jgi:predicted secreted Zn-dependent protease